MKDKVSKNIKDIIISACKLDRFAWRHYKWRVLLTSFLILLVAFSPFVGAAISGAVVNLLESSIRLGHMSDAALILFVSFFLVLILLEIINNISAYLNDVFEELIGAKVKIMIHTKIAELDLARHESPQLKNLFELINMKGGWAIYNYLFQQSNIIRSLLQLVIAAVILMYFNFFVFLAVFIASIPELIINAKHSSRIFGYNASRTKENRMRSMLGNLFTRLPSLTEIKMYQSEKKLVKRLAKIENEEARGYIKLNREKIIADSLVLFLPHAAIIISLIFFAFQVADGTIKIGTFVFLLGSMTNFRHALSSMFVSLGRINEIYPYVVEVFNLFEMEPIISSKEGAKKVDAVAPRIEFKNVSFKYPGTKSYILKNISFVIESGEKIAIVGENAAGKTTLIKMLCRFYDVTKGEVLINGVNIKDIDLDDWRAKVGVLFQDFNHYDYFTIADSIHLGRSHYKFSLDFAKKAAKKARADKMIAKLPKKYREMLGKDFGGVEMSGGEKQRLALAKVHYRNPHFIILDEPTSAMDPKAEREVFENIHGLPNNVTAIFISHRMTTVLEADKICSMHNGKILEFGTHEELLKSKGLYATLYKDQLKKMRIKK